MHHQSNTNTTKLNLNDCIKDKGRNLRVEKLEDTPAARKIVQDVLEKVQQSYFQFNYKLIRINKITKDKIEFIIVSSKGREMTCFIYRPWY